MKEELLALGFSLDGTIMYWKGEGDESIALAYIGEGKYNMSVFTKKREWEFYKEYTKDKVMPAVREYMKRRES